MRSKFRTLLLSVLAIIFIISCSSNISKLNNYSEIDKLITTAVKDSVFPGVALLFGKDDKVLYKKAFGNFTYDQDSKKTSLNSIFDLASVTKVVATTSAAMLLLDKHKLNLDDKVITYLPEFDNNGKNKITIRNLLVHNSGLAPFKKYYDVVTSGEEVINDIMNDSLTYPVGEKFKYSDLGMITLQKVIEKITNQPIDLFLKENFFSLLEMNQTMYNPSDEIKNNCVPTELDDFWRMRLLQGEVHDERAHMLNGVAGHAGLFSTVEDLSIFVRMLLNNGKYKDHQVISSEIIEEWTTKQSEQSDRALGWDTKSMEGYSSAGTKFSKFSFGHTGYTGTSIWIDKKTKLFVILLSNRVHPTRANKKISRLRPELHDAIYNSVLLN